MKSIKLIAMMAMVTTSFTPIMLATPAYAATTLVNPVPGANPADAATLAAMQSQCAILASNHGAAWTGTLNQASIQATLVSGPTETGSHSIADAIGDPVGAGTFTPAHRAIEGDPYRNGGSVNMFGNQVAVGGRYSASTYDFMGEFSTTYSYAFSCDMSETLSYHELVSPEIPATPGTGHHYRMDGNTNAQNCVQMDVRGDHFGETGPGPGADPEGDPNEWNEGGTCLWAWDVEPTDLVEAVYNDYDQEEARPAEAGTAVNQSQTDTLTAHEDLGEGFSVTETLAIGSVVVCISPGRKGGAWTKQNGYTGDKCTTIWYNGGATTGVTNLNTGSHNYVTVPVV